MKKSLEIRRLDIYDAVGVYTIQFLDKAETEFMDFMSKPVGWIKIKHL